MPALVIQSIEETLVKLLDGRIALAKPSDVNRTQALADIQSLDPHVGLVSRTRESSQRLALLVNPLSSRRLQAVNGLVGMSETFVDIEAWSRGESSLQNKADSVRLRELVRIVLEGLSGVYGNCTISSCVIESQGSDLEFAPQDASDHWSFMTSFTVQVFHSVVTGDTQFPSIGVA